MWSEGSIRVGTSGFHYWVKHYEEGSRFGIEGGRISKLELRRNGETAARYERGWDILPADPDTETAVEILKWEFN